MADAYVWSGASGTDSGADWTNAAETLVAGLAAAGNGDKVFVHTGATTPHSESTAASITLTAGIQGAPKIIVAVDKDNSDAYAPIAEGGTAQINTTAGGDIRLDGYGVCYGLGFNADDDITALGAGEFWILEECKIVEGSGSHIQVGNASCFHFINCFVDAGSALSVGMVWARDGGTILVNGGKQINGSSNSGQRIADCDRGGHIIIKDFDASAATAGTWAEAVSSGLVEMYRVKVNSGMTVGLANVTAGGRLICHSVGTADQFYSYYYEDQNGVVQEDTSIYLDATYDGTNGYSLKAVSDAANADEFISPLRFKIGSFWTRDFGSAQTATVQLNYDNATNLQNDECWIDLTFQDETDQVLGKHIYNDGQTPAGTRMTDIQDTPANLSAGSGTWTGTGGWSNENKDSLAVTITAAQAADKQVVTVWGNLCSTGGVANTVYFCPKIQVT